MMKKIIALALALSMALSMVAFAGYTDAALINEDLTADIDLVKALGLMTGNPDGSFNPKGTLTRGEAAVIAYRLSAGKKDIDASWGDASLNNFTDMAGHWSAPYVNYCAALGLILGDPAGTFRPNDAVTAVEMAKMLLNAAGYDTEKQGYGKNWPAAVLADATNSGLFADFEAAYTAPASREWVAKLVANLINKVQTVSYNVYTNALVKNTTGNNNDPVIFGADKYGIKTEVVLAVANEKAAFNGASVSDADDTKEYSWVIADTKIEYMIPTEMLGHNVKVFYKGADLAHATKIYYVTDVTKTLTVAADKVYFKSVDGTSYLHVNGSKTSTAKADLTAAYLSLVADTYALADIKATSSTAKLATSAELTFVDKDGDGKYEAVFSNILQVVKVDTLDVENETIKLVLADDTTVVANIVSDESNNTAGINWENLVFADEIEEGDVVSYEITYTDDGLEVVISKLNPVATTIASKSNGTFVAAGTTYQVAYNPLMGWNYTTFLSNVGQSNLDETVYDLYTDGKYVLYAKTNDGSVVSGLNMNLAYVIEKNSPSGTGAFAETAKVQVLLADGTIAVYEYDGEDGVPFTGSNSVAQYALYNYVINADGTMTFKALATAASHGENAEVTTAGSDAMFDQNSSVTKAFLSDNSTKFYANADTILFVSYYDAEKAGTVYAVVKASELDNDMTAANYTFTTYGYTTSTATGLKTLVYAVVADKATNGLPKGDASGTKYFLTTDEKTEVLTSTGSYWTIPGINAKGEKETLTLTKISGDGVVSPVKNTLYTIKTQGDDTYLTALEVKDTASDALAAGWNQVAITAATDSMVEIAGNLYDVAADAVITYVYTNTSNKVTLKTSGLPTALPFGNADEVLVKVKSSNGTFVVTDMIITVTSSANDITTNIIKNVNP